MKKHVLLGAPLLSLSCSGHAADAGGPANGGNAGTAVDTSASVLQRNKHASHDGHFIQPTLTKARAATMKLDTDFHADFTGAMYASPLYLEDGPGGKGVFFAVT